MNCEIISIGTELLLGQIVNSNATYLSEQLSELGINVFYHTVVGDNLERLKNTIKLALSRSNLIITTGGLGPTLDDLTKEAIAGVVNRKMILYPEAVEHIKKFFQRINKPMTNNNLRQAMF
ncbi:MAG TPA: competence/damage-inducible protein A, partial [Clostridia bacterium]|nr:competence/damage-inducible protein A [Clostridia bacterium]